MLWELLTEVDRKVGERLGCNMALEARLPGGGTYSGISATYNTNFAHKTDPGSHVTSSRFFVEP